MIILAVETSTMAGSVALMKDEGVLAEYMLNLQITHSERLLKTINQVLCDSDILVKDIDSFAVSLGPGSFTGLRIGVSTIKGLAWSLGKPVIGIPTLDSIAGGVTFTDYLICPMLDARKREVYTSLFKYNGKSKLNKITRDIVIDPLEFLSRIKEKTVFLGNGSELYRAKIEEILGEKALFASPALNYPRACLIAYMGMIELKDGNYTDAFKLKPIYIRPSEAEIKFKILKDD